ncbi:MAG: hypothetical protein EAZ92_11775 [Candidatus Kapaibacterium sp.]|nr:MAG: hypothetical protein EAZ92_11775 [Candidatus Kapabacteria bacterium]
MVILLEVKNVFSTKLCYKNTKYYPKNHPKTPFFTKTKKIKKYFQPKNDKKRPKNALFSNVTEKPLHMSLFSWFLFV